MRDFGYKGLGRARAGGLCAALLTAAALAACATQKPSVGPWGYEFSLGTFSDQRTDEDARLMSAIPFTVDSFMTGWRNNVGRNVFANAPAKLDITLRSFDASTSGKSYAISMDVGLRGRDMENRPLGTMNGTCSAAVQMDANSWGDFWQQTREQRSITPLTPVSRNATMWQKVMDACVKELATQFGTVLAAGTR